MALNLCFLWGILCLTISLASGDDEQVCYACNVPGCTVADSQVVNCNSGLCFMLSMNVFETYRGCFTEGAQLYTQCQDRQFSSCQVCKGSLCNDWSSLITNVEMSCVKCAKGVCEFGKELKNFVRCPYFVYPQLPRCFSIVDRFTNEYTFGCANEMTNEQMLLCEKDWFQSVCKYCDTINCNTRFFRGENPVGLLCYNGKTRLQIIFCTTKDNHFPYYGCFSTTDETQEDYGCLSDLYSSPDDSNYLELFTGKTTKNDILVCFESLCNDKFDTSRFGITVCSRIYCPTAEYGSSECALYRSYNKFGNIDQRYRCMGRFPCWRAESCVSPCNSVDAGNFNVSCPNPLMECYSCVDCPTVNADSPFQRRSCDKTTNICLTLIFKNNTIVRGCYDGVLVEMCLKAGDGNCELCRTSGCNSKLFDNICHTCTSLNPMCAYEQEETFIQLCPHWTRKNLNTKNQCFYRVTPMNEVTRGCLAPNEPVCDPDNPKTYKHCERCGRSLCNSSPLVNAHCVTCTGNFSEKCATDIEFLSLDKTTMNCAVGYERPHCYISIADGQITRGCVSHRNFKLMKITCNQDYEMCFFCDFENCNYFQVLMESFTGDKRAPVQGMQEKKDTRKNVGSRLN